MAYISFKWRAQTQLITGLLENLATFLCSGNLHLSVIVAYTHMHVPKPTHRVHSCATETLLGTKDLYRTVCSYQGPLFYCVLLPGTPIVLCVGTRDLYFTVCFYQGPLSYCVFLPGTSILLCVVTRDPYRTVCFYQGPFFYCVFTRDPYHTVCFYQGPLLYCVL